MRRQGKLLLSSLAVTIALVTVGSEVATAQRAPGGPPGPSEFDAFYTLGPDSLPREGVPKGEVRGPFSCQATRTQGWSTTIGFTFRHSMMRRGK